MTNSTSGISDQPEQPSNVEELHSSSLKPFYFGMRVGPTTPVQNVTAPPGRFSESTFARSPFSNVTAQNVAATPGGFDGYLFGSKSSGSYGTDLFNSGMVGSDGERLFDERVIGRSFNDLLYNYEKIFGNPFIRSDNSPTSSNIGPSGNGFQTQLVSNFGETIPSRPQIAPIDGLIEPPPLTIAEKDSISDPVINAIVDVTTGEVLGHWAINHLDMAEHVWQSTCSCGKKYVVRVTACSKTRFNVNIREYNDDECALRWIKALLSKERHGTRLTAKEIWTSQPDRLTKYHFLRDCDACGQMFAVELGQVGLFTMAVHVEEDNVSNTDFISEASCRIDDLPLSGHYTTWIHEPYVQWALHMIQATDSRPCKIEFPSATDNRALTRVEVRPRGCPLRAAKAWLSNRDDLYCRRLDVQELASEYHEPVQWERDSKIVTAATPNQLSSLEEYLDRISVLVESEKGLSPFRWFHHFAGTGLFGNPAHSSAQYMSRAIDNLIEQADNIEAKPVIERCRKLVQTHKPFLRRIALPIAEAVVEQAVEIAVDKVKGKVLTNSNKESQRTK